MSEGSKTVGARLREAVSAHRLQFDAAQLDAAARLDRLAAELRAGAPGWLGRWRSRLGWKIHGAAPRGLYLWGGVGRGKTLLMDAFFASLQPFAGERAHFYRFMRGVHAELAGARGGTRPLERVAARIAARARVLCLDEFFVADIGDAMILSGLFAGLFSRGVTLVATSNVAPRDLYKDGLQRQRFLPAIELLEEHVEALRLDSGVDYRLRTLERAPTYLDSSRPGTHDELAQRFRELAGGAAPGPVTLTIEGRPLRAIGAAGDTAWFDFRELCVGPRSQNDYIELARMFGTVFISDIPVLTPLDEDAARRLIMLIDELYDRRVKPVISAAAPPAELYRGERLRLEFERAASRLVEMQTQHYLAGEHRA